jgi:hypothetical protein
MSPVNRSTTYRNALREVSKKTDAQIERKTALTWADRAEACFTKHRATKNVKWLLRAQRFADEALEHAAQVGDEGKLVGQLQRQLRAAERDTTKTDKTRRSRRV